MSGPIYYQRMPDDDRPSWAGILVLACLALGLLAAMVELERSQSLSDRQYAKATATSYIVQQARLEDLGKTLADKNTRLIHLQSSADHSMAGAALAVNQTLHSADLFCDGLLPLDSDQKYQVWGITPDGAATHLGDVTAEPGVSVYPFSWTPDLTGLARIEINSGDRAAGATISYFGSLQ
jgi:hypothetical protein